MITKTQWNRTCSRIAQLIYDYDVYINGFLVDSVPFDKGIIKTKSKDPGIYVVYSFKHSLKQTRSLEDLHHKIKIKTKPSKVIDTNLWDYK